MKEWERGEDLGDVGSWEACKKESVRRTEARGRDSVQWRAQETDKRGDEKAGRCVRVYWRTGEWVFLGQV